MKLFIVCTLFSLHCLGQKSDSLAILKANYNQKAYDCAYVEDFACAIQYFSEVIKICPQDSFVYLDRGYIKAQIKDFTGAIEDYTQQIKIDQSNPDNYFLRAEAFDHLEKYKEAILDYSIVMKMDKGNADARFFRGLDKSKLSNHKGAIKDFNAAIKIDPFNPNYYLQKAEVYLLLDKLTEACDAFSQFKSISNETVTTKLYDLCH